MTNLKKCNDGFGGVKQIILYNSSDWKQNKDGNFVLKRKYGKFNRLPYNVIDRTNNK